MEIGAPIYTFTREQFLCRPIREVFSFFTKPENLAFITPHSLHFRLLSPRPVVMKRGALIDYRVRILGIPLHWTTLVEFYDPPRRFTDLQLKGPYAYWHHAHNFSSKEGGTLIQDEVRYSLRWGLAGRIANALFVRRELAAIFNYREKALQILFQDRRKKGYRGPLGSTPVTF